MKSFLLVMALAVGAWGQSSQTTIHKSQVFSFSNLPKKGEDCDPKSFGQWSVNNDYLMCDEKTHKVVEDVKLMDFMWNLQIHRDKLAEALITRCMGREEFVEAVRLGDTLHFNFGITFSTAIIVQQILCAKEAHPAHESGKYEKDEGKKP